MRSSQALGAVFLAAIFFLFSCSMPADTELPVPEDERPDAVFTDFSREQVVKSVVTFVAKAARAEYFKSTGTLVVYKAVFEDFGESGGPAQFSGEADKVVWHEDSGDAELSGYVRLYSRAEDASFETGSLKYHHALDTIEGAEGDTVIVRVGSKLLLRGMGFFADIGKRAFAFRQGAQGVIKIGGAESEQGVNQ
jgi:LPS export ABC transporter protein LptC